ncbi:MAG: hypothetical protein BGP14_08225 [Sphingobacteriales bacterium 44-15]|nr:MAG: hypothetical protein BGP14_08225 [Sphingobacteriales bacterium 44-15]
MFVYFLQEYFVKHFNVSGECSQLNCFLMTTRLQMISNWLLIVSLNCTCFFPAVFFCVYDQPAKGARICADSIAEKKFAQCGGEPFYHDEYAVSFFNRKVR